MKQKFVLACAAVSAFAAFVVAPAASATTLTENGKALAVGTVITVNNTALLKFTGAFNVQCEVVQGHGTVTQNNSVGPAKGTIPVGGVTFTNAGGAPCSSALGATTVKVTSELCLETIAATDTVKTTGCGANVVFDLIVGGITCKYEIASISSTFTTNESPTKVVVSEQPAKEVGGLFFCPDEGKMDATYQTSAATGLTIS